MKNNINNKHCEDIEQTGSVINKLIWIAGNWENKEVNEMLESIPEDHIAEIFRKHSNFIKWTKEKDWDGQFSQLLIDCRMFGFIAECHMPYCDGFSYDQAGSPTSWSVHQGHCRIFYVYAETPSQIVKEMSRQSRIFFKEMIEKDKSKVA